ncbi:C-type lectin lectoxin-Phi1-like isoform X1 [Mizuhopecten yessoensis]|uniref:C-type lectin lectoxin-Phi1-like isoform X1 n=1 Tax=Mizuhopecten yessoensis TaxID=6573 RepID=UPI000B457890|nr:C-type lectin lectoxin-Phi1-like isoform X1 [Mizuhopecten yessoensis]
MARLHFTFLALKFVIFGLGWHHTEAIAKCRDGWIQYEQSCYLFVTSSETWVEHMQHCIDVDGHLATVNNAAENSFLEAEVQRRRVSFWIGGTDIDKNNTWVWIEDNTPLPMPPCGRSNNFCAWGEDEPNNLHRHQHCLELNIYVHWNDNECTLSRGAICEAKPKPHGHWITLG